MATKVYIHEYVELQCYIVSATQKAVKIALPSPNRWSSNLESILKRIPNKFKFLLNFDESQWILTVNNITIDKHDPIKFGELLSTKIPPIAVIEIIKSNEALPVNSKKYLKIHYYESSSLNWTPSNSQKNNYNDLLNTIT
eukprot:541096_1